MVNYGPVGFITVDKLEKKSVNSCLPPSSCVDIIRLSAISIYIVIK